MKGFSRVAKYRNHGCRRDNTVMSKSFKCSCSELENEKENVTY